MDRNRTIPRKYLPVREPPQTSSSAKTGLWLMERWQVTEVCHRCTHPRIELQSSTRICPSVAKLDFSSHQRPRRYCMQAIRVEREIGGKTLSIETGTFAKLADGAAPVQ